MNTKEEVAALLTELANDRAIATAEIPTDVEAKDIPLYQIGKVRAQERIRDNENKYRFFVDSHIGLIIPQGTLEKQKEFAAIASQEGDTHTFNTLDPYRALVKNAYALMGGTGSFTTDGIADIYGHLRIYVRRELGIFRLRDPDISWIMSKYVPSLDSLADDVRVSVDRSSGLMMITKAINKYVCDEAVRNPVPRMIIPVVALEVRPDEVAAYGTMYPGRVVVVNLDEAKDIKSAVLNTFTQLKTQFK